MNLYYLILLIVAFVTAESKVALFPFENNSGNESLDFIAATLENNLGETLERAGEIQILERSRLTALLQEKSLELTGLVENPGAYEFLPADFLVLGAYSGDLSNLTFDLRAVEKQSGAVRLQRTFRGSLDKVIDQIKSQRSELQELLLQVQKFGLLSVLSRPEGARVFLNEKNFGKTPLRNVKVLPGTYQLKVEAEGHFEQLESIALQADKEFLKSFELKPKVAPFRPRFTSSYSVGFLAEEVLPTLSLGLGAGNATRGFHFNFLMGLKTLDRSYGVPSRSDLTIGEAAIDKTVEWLGGSFNYYYVVDLKNPVVHLVGQGELGFLNFSVKQSGPALYELSDKNQVIAFAKPEIGLRFFPESLFQVGILGGVLLPLKKLKTQEIEQTFLGFEKTDVQESFRQITVRAEVSVSVP